MKKLFLLLSLAAAPMLLPACSSDDPAPQTVFSPEPAGALTSLKTGTVTPQNGTPTNGSLAIVRDEQNREYVQLNPDFTSDFHTGTVTVYLAKTAARIGEQRAAAATNVRAVGFVNKNGKQFLELKDGSAGFNYVVFYCETAEINFGNSQLK